MARTCDRCNARICEGLSSREEGTLLCVECARSLNESRSELFIQQHDQEFLLEAADAGSWQWDMETGVVLWSEQLERLHGMAPGTFGRSFEAFLDMVIPDDRPQVLQAIERAASGEDPQLHMEHRGRQVDGTVHWFESKGRVVRDSSGRATRMIGICLGITRRKRAELTMHALADAGAVLATSLDHETTLSNVARLLVPQWADMLAIDLLADGGRIENAITALVEPDKAELIEQMRQCYRPRLDDRHGAGRVIRTRQPLCYREVTDETLQEHGRDQQHLQMLRQLAVRSAVVVPLNARGEIIGAMTLATVEQAQPFTEDDLPHLQELAHRCAMALDNAQLHQESERELAHRKQIEQALRESEAWSRQMVDGTAVGIYTTDRAGRILRYNEEAVKIWGRRPVIEGSDAERICGSMRIYRPDGTAVPLELCPMADVLRDGRPSRNAEILIERPDGSRVIALANPSPIRDEQGRMIGAINCLIDITERKLAQQRAAERTAEAEARAHQLQRLAVEMTQTEQRERTKLARLLHDGVQQLLVGAKFQAVLLEQTQSDGLPAAVNGLVQVLDEAATIARSLSHELSPPMLHTKGLGTTLRWLVKNRQHGYGLRVHVKADEAAEPQSNEGRVLLYQAVRELLLNVFKHGQTDEVWIAMRRDAADRVVITVEDHGRGFDARQAEVGPEGLGLFGMEERLALLGGGMQIDSEPGRGTRVTLRLPRNTVAGDC